MWTKVKTEVLVGAFRLAAGNTGRFMLVCIPLPLMLSVLLALGLPLR